MICEICNEKIRSEDYIYSFERGMARHYACPRKAEHREALPGCPPSATGCPDARAVGQVGADSSGRCPENSGPDPVTIDQWSLTKAHDLTCDIDSHIKMMTDLRGYDAYTLRRLVMISIRQWREDQDAPQRSGERALPGNGELSDRTPKT